MILATVSSEAFQRLAATVGGRTMSGRLSCEAVVDSIVDDAHLGPSEALALRNDLFEFARRLASRVSILRSFRKRELAEPCIQGNAEIFSEELGIPLESATASLRIVWCATVFSP